MWLLSCDGDLFDGKRMWLAPGSTHLFGRTSAKSETGERIKYIENKSVSRKHLTFKVHSVAQGSSSRIHERSKIEITDGSKIGTLVNGRKIVGTTEALDGTEYTFKLGNYEHLLRLLWHPVVLCHSGGGSKKNQDPFAQQRPALEAADIKLVKDYVSNSTTHSVSKKRNTPTNLQALVQGRWLVSDAYTDALAKAVKSSGGEEGSALEVDFDGKWPKEKDYVTPAGTEPVQRANRFYLPDPQRVDIFSDFVFLFLRQSQYDNLLSVITSGSGKALIWEFEEGESRVEEFVEYVRAAAGHKKSGQSRLTQVTGAGGVVLVEPTGDDAALHQFTREAEATLGQRAIAQSELLDVILTLDTSSLRQPIKEMPKAPSPDAIRQPSPTPAQRPTRQSQRAVSVHDSPPAPEMRPPTRDQPEEAEQQQEEQPATTSRRRHKRYVTQSRFKGFDDDFDPSQFTKPVSQSPAPSFEVSQQASVQDMDVDEPSQAPRTQQSSRKRPIKELEKEDGDAMYDKLLPGQAAMKRHKTEIAAKNGDRDGVVAHKVAEYKAETRKTKAKTLDVMAEVQKRREKEHEARRKDEESLREAMDGVDLEDLKDLAKIEEMDLPVRDRPARNADNGRRDGRWDPQWNGRKNFKKFRPQGAREDGPRLQRVIVALEEVPRKGQGIGDEYWLQTSRTSKSKSQSQSQTQSSRHGRSQQQQRGGVDDGNDDDEEDERLQFRRRIESSRREDAEAARSEAVHPEDIAGGRARDPSLAAAAAASLQGTPSQTMRAESQRKRPAVSQAGPAAAKRAKASAREVVDLDEDDDDELKFRRRRR